MPTYQYRREDGSTFEIQQRITEDALTVCPTTGQSVRRVISGKAGLLFKGDGFYLTDYTSYGKEGTGKGGEKKGEGTSDSADAKSGEATPAAESTAKKDSTPAKADTPSTGGSASGGAAAGDA